MRHAIQRTRRAFTLIELIAVIVVLAILAGVALPKVLDLSEDAKQSAADGTISAVQTALINQYVDNRATDAPEAQWITSPAQMASTMQFDEKNYDLKINGNTITDQAGNTWTFTPETGETAARLVADQNGGGGGPDPNNGSGNGGSLNN